MLLRFPRLAMLGHGQRPKSSACLALPLREKFVTVGAEGRASGFAAPAAGHFVASVVNFIAGFADSRRYSGRGRRAITT